MSIIKFQGTLSFFQSILTALFNRIFGEEKKGSKMITVKEAQNFLEKEKFKQEGKIVPLEDSVGQILAEDIFAERPQPPFNRVAMDGVSLLSSAWLSDDKRPLTTEGVQAAGTEALTLSDPMKCFEVMTGAPLPKGCDTVIPYEHCHFLEKKKPPLDKREVVLKDPYTFSPGQNIHKICLLYTSPSPRD